jgi:hypothetical protein
LVEAPGLAAVFYATFARSTAVAELRPGIGDSIAIGRFTTRVPLKVFDFTVVVAQAGADAAL